MKLNIKATTIDLTPEITGYIEKRLGKIEPFIDALEEKPVVRVEVGKTTLHHESGLVYRAEIQVYYLGKVLRAVAEAEDLYAAVDQAQEEIIEEITARKKLRQTFARRSGRFIKDMLRRFYR